MRHLLDCEGERQSPGRRLRRAWAILFVDRNREAIRLVPRGGGRRPQTPWKRAAGFPCHWLRTKLKSIAGKKDNKALVMATHHPPYSQPDMPAAGR